MPAGGTPAPLGSRRRLNRTRSLLQRVLGGKGLATGEGGTPAAAHHRGFGGQVAGGEAARIAERVACDHIRALTGGEIGIGRGVEGPLEGGNAAGAQIGRGDEPLIGNGVFAEALAVFAAVEHGVHDAVEALAGGHVEVGIDLPAPEGGAAQQAPVHHLDRLADVEPTPVAAAEGITAGHLAHKFPQAEVAVFELDLLHLVVLTGIAGVAENLHIHRADHPLGAGFGVAHTGLSAAAGHGGATGSDLLEPHHLGPHLAGRGGTELGAVHLARLAHAIAHQDAAAVVAEGGRAGGHIGRA